jgi:hypothetical protein
VSPGVFFFFVTFTAPEVPFTISVDQSGIANYDFKMQEGEPMQLLDANCNKLTTGMPVYDVNGNPVWTISSGTIEGAQYVLSVKYDTKSILGAPWPGPISYGFTSLINGLNDGVGTAYLSLVTKTGKSGDLTEAQLPEAIEPAVSSLQVYPNPSSGIVNFEFVINESAKATLDLLSATGQKVATIFNENVEAGITQKVIYTQTLATGVYVYTLRWNDQVITGKLIITR